MAPEPYDPDRIQRLQDPAAFRYCSGEELRAALMSSPEWRIADLGSGTGLFTSELAPVAETVYAVDVRPGLHAVYRENGRPANVIPLIAGFESLPFPEGHLDGAVSMRTYHHGFADALGEIGRVLRPGGRLVVVDWSATGAGDREGGMADHYVTLADAQAALLDAGFSIPVARERRETFLVVAENR